jgi:hypothetical protein
MRDPNEVLPFEILNEGMIGIEALGGSLQGIPGESEPTSKPRIVQNTIPCGGTLNDSLPDLGEGLCIGMPDPHSRKEALGLEVEVEPGAMGIPPRFVAELNPCIGLVRRFVFGKTGITVDSE